MKIQTTTIKFPELELKTRDAHKLRGFFGNLFKEKSELLHNHFEDGTLRYNYPLVQYKVIENIPFLVGINQGAELLVNLFLKINHINIDGNHYVINSKNITTSNIEFDDFATLKEYKFATLWMALNQKNHKKYEVISQEEKEQFLNKTLQNNILSFFKGVDVFVKENIMVMGKFSEKNTKFKEKEMIAFSGSFVTNALLPEYIGVGKSVSRGFGTVIHKK